ncbi:MAG: hypothetical protein J2P49_01445, partial [Methylocapsa sp.]|nr:hypothetical protein [Methylocapsa sp.]
MEARICMYAAGWMSLLIFVVVPILTVVLGYDQAVFEGGEISSNLLMLNALSAMPYFVAAQFRANSAVTYQLNRSSPTECPIDGVSLFIICWTAAFLLSGGLTYRVDDLSLGIDARNPMFDLIQRLGSTIQILCTYLFLVMPRLAMPLRVLAIASIISYCAGLILSGSRFPV